MKGILKRLSVLLVFALCINLIPGCQKRNINSNIEDDLVSSANKDYDIFIYNSKVDISEELQKLCNYYASEFGVKIKVVSLEDGPEYVDKLKEAFNSSQVPMIFSINGLNELCPLEKVGYVLDLKSSSEDDFNSIVDEIPEELRLSSNNINSCGIPFATEGFGYIADKQMLADLFSESNVDLIISDLKSSSYQEFEELVKCIDRYINKSETSTITLNGNKYKILGSKTDLIKNLEGVFSFACSKECFSKDITANTALCSSFDSALSSYKAGDNHINSLYNPMLKYLEALNLNTSYSLIKRGNQFIDSNENGYEKALEKFSSGKSLFFNGGNWVLRKIEKLNPDIKDRLVILPIKMPFESSDIKNKNVTVEKLNSSIPVFSSMYYAINAKSGVKEQKLAQKFLLWLNTSEEGKDYIQNIVKEIPYNYSDKSNFSLGSLNDSILEYKKSGNTLKACYQGTPYKWLSEVNNKIYDEYLIKEQWNEEDYKNISKYAIDEWKKLY